MNAHINFDLPQVLLASITDDEFDDEALVASRAADHAHIDSVLVTRVGPEDLEPGQGGAARRPHHPRPAADPFNRSGTRRFLRESRRKTWHNARLLSRPAPGQVILKLAVKGFGVQLPHRIRDRCIVWGHSQ